MEGHVDCIVYRPVGFVGELQWIQEWVCDGSEVGQHKALKGHHDNRGQGDSSVVLIFCEPCFFGHRDDGGGFKAGLHVAYLN